MINYALKKDSIPIFTTVLKNNGPWITGDLICALLNELKPEHIWTIEASYASLDDEADSLHAEGKRILKRLQTISTKQEE